MPHVITETATFTPTVSVPDGTDTMVAAAETVAAIAQALANRSRFLKAVTDDAVTKTGNNTFTGTNTFNGATTLASVTVTGGAQINGNISASDGTVNVSGGLAVSGAAQAGSLAVTGGAQINGNISASDGTVNVTGNLATAGDASGATLTSAGNVRLSSNAGDVVYTSGSPPLRAVNIPLFTGKDISNGTYDDLFDTWGVAVGGSPAVIRFAVPPVPRGSTAIGLEAVWRAHDVAAANAATLRMNAQEAWGTTAGDLVDPTDPEDLLTVTQVAGFSTTQCTFSTVFLPALHTVNNAAEAFFIDVTLMDGPNNRLFGLRAFFLDPGARNG
jgi:cytoskeletal protein CcmA (bactofilin family)